MTTSFTVSGDEHQRESGREREGGTERASESGDMVLVAYAGPESPAAALCNIGICHISVNKMSVYVVNRYICYKSVYISI